MERKIAKKVPVSDLNKGTYIKRPGWEPSGVLTKYGEITRVNLIGVIVSKSQTENTLTVILDDGTGSISIRFFERPLEEYKIGDFIKVIGRVREGSNTIYIVPEIMKKVNKKWHEFHNLELSVQKITSPKLPIEPLEDQDFEEGPYQKILNAISMLDQGNGVDIQEIVSYLKINGCEKILQNLIEEGEIFEIKPGKVKLLE
jgi:RPA family protein